jgi:hypothetical protein
VNTLAQLELLSEPLNQDRPDYRPPYDSPIEDALAYPLVKYLDPDVSFSKQHRIRTFCASFRVDFYIAHNSRRIAIECDGKKFHNSTRDLVRDTLILGSGAVETIFRVQGKDAYYRPEDCLYLIAQYCPEFFSERGRANLETLASPEAKSASLSFRQPFISIKHEISDDDVFDLIPWMIHLQARSFRPTDYYDFMFQEFWDIIGFRRLQTMQSMIDLFSDVPSLIDEHLALLRSMSQSEYRWYKAKLAITQSECTDFVVPPPPNRRFQFHKRGKLFIRTHNEAFPVAAMRVNKDCSPERIHG